MSNGMVMIGNPVLDQVVTDLTALTGNLGTTDGSLATVQTNLTALIAQVGAIAPETVIENGEFTAAAILALLLTADGTGSLLDADLLDSHQWSEIQPMIDAAVGAIPAPDTLGDVAAASVGTVGTYALALWLRQRSPVAVNQQTLVIGPGIDIGVSMPKHIELKYFSEKEFRDWWDLMDPDLLIKLDRFRALINKKVKISGNDHALGRYLGGAGSYHNVDRHGKVRAVDTFPEGLNSVNAKWYEQKAVEAGLGGIGFYPHWNGGFGMHVDNGPVGRRWAYDENGKEVGIDHAYA